MCHSHLEKRVVLKYADDTVIVSLLKNNENSHGRIINDFVEWCEDMIIDFRKNVCMDKVTYIKGETEECVQSYKYLGTIIDSKLSFEAN